MIGDQGSGIRAQFLHRCEGRHRAVSATTGSKSSAFSREFPRPADCTAGPHGYRIARASCRLATRHAVLVQPLILRLPPCEKYALASQLRRSTTSIPFNIAEGWARPTRAYINHLGIALGSEAELKTQLKVAVMKQYATQDEVAPMLSMASEIGRMLHGLIKSLRRRLKGRASIPDPDPDPDPDP